MNYVRLDEGQTDSFYKSFSEMCGNKGTSVDTKAHRKPKARSARQTGTSAPVQNVSRIADGTAGDLGFNCFGHCLLAVARWIVASCNEELRSTDNTVKGRSWYNRIRGALAKQSLFWQDAELK